MGVNRKSRWTREVKRRFSKTGVAFKAVLGTIIFLIIGAIGLIVGFGCSMSFGKLFRNIWNFITGPSGLYWVVIIAIALILLIMLAVFLYVKDSKRREGE